MLTKAATTQPLLGQQSTQRRVAFTPPPPLPEPEIASAFFPEEEEFGEDAPPADTLPVLPVEVGLRYTYPEVLGIAEVSYVFPAGLTYILADGTSIENDALAPGMQLILKDGAIATVTDVHLFYEPPDPPVRRSDGLYLSRVIGTIRHKGPMTVDVTWPGFTATSSPDHPYYSVSRRGYVPAQELQVGEFLLNDKDEIVPVQAVSKTKIGMTELYNLEVEHFHNYYVGKPDGGAVLVHNSAKGPYINTPAEAAKEIGAYPIPKGGLSIADLQAQLPVLNARRAQLGQRPITIREAALAKPSEWYFDPKKMSYLKRPAPLVDLTKAGLVREIPCFPAGVVVATPEGRLAISKVRVGTEVLAFDERTGEVVTRRVTHIYRGKTQQLVDITVGDEVISATLKHRFWEEQTGQWVAARDLLAGRSVRCADASERRIEGVQVRQVAEQDPFNLTVEDCHTYFVGETGVLVHNSDAKVNLVYFGYAPTDTTFADPRYVGRTDDLATRQTRHRLDAVKEPTKYGFKSGIVLRPQIDGLTLAQAMYHEAALYHRMADQGHKWGNIIPPMLKDSLAELVAQHC